MTTQLQLINIIIIIIIITVKIIAMNNNQCHAEQSILRSQQLFSSSFNSLSSTKHISSLLYSPQPDWPNFYSPSTYHLFSHIFFTEQHSYYSPHVQCTSHTILTHQNEGQKIETLTNQAIPNLIHQSQIRTNNIWWSSNLEPHQPYLKQQY